MNKLATLAAIAVMSTTVISGCSAVKAAMTTPTCSEYAAMAEDTGLMADLSTDQRAAIAGMLAKHDKDDSETNVGLAALQIVAYCNIYGGKAGSHESDPIDGIPGLQE